MAVPLPTLRAAFSLAWPASLAAIVTPLLGLVDAGVLARAAGPADIAGVALAGAVFASTVPCPRPSSPRPPSRGPRCEGSDRRDR